MKRNSQQRRGQQRRRQNGQPAELDIWRPGGPLPELVPIERSDSVGALTTSLGEPPLPGGKDVGPYFQSVVERAANTAAVLASVVGVDADSQVDRTA
jgi:hypothetical protein